MIGRRTIDLVVWDMPSQRIEFVRQLRRTGSVRDFEFVIRSHGGARRNLLLSGVIVRISGEPLLFATARDVTEQRATEVELVHTATDLRRIDAERRALLVRLVNTQEEERRRIAVELNDDPVQKMAAVGMRLEVLARSLTGTPLLEKVREAGETVNLTIHRMRRLISELRPATLERSGLVAAVRELLDGLAEDDAFAVRLRSDLTCEPRVEDRILAYRIVQEALANVARHAEAANVDVLIDERDDGLYLRVTDDGRGFDVDTADEEDASASGIGSGPRSPAVGGVCRAHPATGHSSRAGPETMPGRGARSPPDPPLAWRV